MKKEEAIALWSIVSRGLRPKVKDEILVPSGKGGTFLVRDYVAANCLVGEYLKWVPDADLSVVESKRDMLLAIPKLCRYRMDYFTPCLAVRIDEVKADVQEQCYTDAKWVATEKIDGVRAWLCVWGPDVMLFSRFYSPVDCTLVDYWGKVDQAVVGSKPVMCADVEITFNVGAEEFIEMEANMPKSEVLNAFLEREDAKDVQRAYKAKTGRDMLVFHLIAPLFYHGTNYADKLIGFGAVVYDAMVADLQDSGLNVVALKRCSGSKVEKENFLSCILANGGEGIVFHNMEGWYCTSENRSKNSYIKVKRGVGVRTGMGDTVDAFVTGFKLDSAGMISALEFSVWMIDAGDTIRKWVASVGGMSTAAKRAMALGDASGMYPTKWVDADGIDRWVSLNPRWDGAVAELSGAGMNERCQIEKPEFVQWRRERDNASCVYTKEWMLSQVIE